MAHNTGRVLVAAIIGVMFNTAGAGDDTLRCGSRLVSTGDGKDKVRTLCGEPTSVSFAGMVRRGRYDYDGPYDDWYFGPGWVELPVEYWTYNFGSNKLLRKLRFVGDELVEIRTEGYGY